MLFCPTCGNLLLVEAVRVLQLLGIGWWCAGWLTCVCVAWGIQVGSLRFFCQTCPYIHSLREPVRAVASACAATCSLW